jgi:hypothetical protein
VVVTVRQRLPNRAPKAGKVEYLERRVQIRIIIPSTWVLASRAGDVIGSSGLVDGRALRLAGGQEEPQEMSDVGLRRERLEFADWMLLGLLRIDTAVPVHFVDPVRVGNRGPELDVEVDGMRQTLLFDPETLVPSELSFDVPGVDQTGRALGANLHSRIVADEREDIDGIKWPRRIRYFTTLGGGKEALNKTVSVEAIDLSPMLSTSTALTPWQ